MISAKVIKDSISESGKRLTTLQLCFPRCILSEFNTHRQFSRNAASSRAIPVKKMIQDVIDNPFIPLHWGKNQPGMQAFEETNNTVVLDEYDLQSYMDQYVNYFIKIKKEYDREKAWLKARDNAVEIAEAFADAGYHKQLVNRLLEPFMWTHVLVTSTEWNNFLRLRNHPDAEPHIRILAQKMEEALNTSTPKLLKQGEWHLPYITDEDKPLDELIKVSVARSARLSYYTFDGKISTFDKDLELFSKLAEAEPEHGSPFEHQATPDKPLKLFSENYLISLGIKPFIMWNNPHLHGNLVGWKQYRKIYFKSELYK